MVVNIPPPRVPLYPAVLLVDRPVWTRANAYKLAPDARRHPLAELMILTASAFFSRG